MIVVSFEHDSNELVPIVVAFGRLTVFRLLTLLSELSLTVVARVNTRFSIVVNCVK